MKKIKKDPQRIKKMKRFTQTYNQEGINYAAGKDDQKKLEKNNQTIALNVLYGKKRKLISYLLFKTKHKAWKTSYSFNDFKHRRIPLSCSEKNIIVIKKSNVQILR